MVFIPCLLATSIARPASLNTMTTTNVQDYFDRYEEVKTIDQSKNALIEVRRCLPHLPVLLVTNTPRRLQDLLRRVTELEDAYQRTRLDHERETRFNRGVQMHEIELMEQISRIKTIMVRHGILCANSQNLCSWKLLTGS